jgi:beta-alanine--pyruvate transaminase
MATLDYSPAFQYGHELSFELANKLKELTPAGLDYVFFTGSGSESADTSLKMARAYWRTKGQASKTRVDRARKRLSRRQLWRHLGRRHCGQPQDLWSGHRSRPPAPHAAAKNAFSRGMPDKGVELADELLRMIALHDASNIAAVIVEPFSGSAGVVIPPKLATCSACAKFARPTTSC